MTQVLQNRPHLFNAYFAASGVSNQKGTESWEKFVAADHSTRPKYLFFTLGAGEDWLTARIDAFSKVLTEKAGDGLRWEYELLEEDDHWSTPYRTIYRGLLKYYEDFRPIRFKSLEEFEEKGGLTYLNEHFAKRGDKYNVSKKVHRRTVFSLLSRAMSENNYPAFENFMNRFGESQLGDWYKWDHWQRFLHRYGQFYLKHNQVDKALALFKVTREKFPEEAFAYNDLGDGFRAKGLLEEAKTYYEKAVVLATAAGDPGLEKYQADLDSLTRK